MSADWTTTRRLIAALLAAAMIALFPGTAASAAPPVPAGVHCNVNDPITLRANWNNRYVTTQKNYTGSTTYGMLRAVAEQVGTWEMYYLCYVDGWQADEFALLAEANGKFVTAEFDYSGTNDGMLRARADRPDVWERFLWHYDINGSFLQSTWTGQYVTAEHDFSGTRKSMLRAARSNVDVWERFTIIWL